MRLDDLRAKPHVEPLSDRLWRRYGRRAFQMLDAISDDPSMGRTSWTAPTTCASNSTSRRAPRW